MQFTHRVYKKIKKNNRFFTGKIKEKKFKKSAKVNKYKKHIKNRK